MHVHARKEIKKKELSITILQPRRYDSFSFLSAGGQINFFKSVLMLLILFK